MWRMLQRERADDFLLATGNPHSVEDFLQAAFEAVDLNWRDYVQQDPRYLRPSEVCQLVGDPSKAEQQLGWHAQIQLPELARIMVESDLQSIRQQGGI